MKKAQFLYELNEHIIPFWNKLRDERGGFFGQMNQQLEVFKDADKGVILHSRILWFYSAAYKLTGNRELRDYAEHAFRFLRDKCFDSEYGGVFWSIAVDGKPSDTLKHTYNQAFAVYALSAYSEAFSSDEALGLALKLFGDIESNAFSDADGQYGEAFTHDWKASRNDELSENGISADRTMNTVLHLTEAYTELYRISKNAAVGEKLRRLLDITDKFIVNSEQNALNVFFDKEMRVLGDIHSYGHDIEACWLLDRACDVLGDMEQAAHFEKINLKIADNILRLAFDNGALNSERDGRFIDKKRIWWIQAESVTGFYNAYQRSGDERFKNAAETIFDFILNYQIDKRSGEWFPELDYSGTPIDGFDMAGQWKCPYHNGRMCIEMYNRLTE